MPTYQYECNECSHSFEILQSMLELKLKKCPKCGNNTLHRLIGAGSGIIFKGSGFYETDYKKKAAAKEPATDDTNVKTEPAAKPMSDQKASKGEKSIKKEGQPAKERKGNT